MPPDESNRRYQRVTMRRATRYAVLVIAVLSVGSCEVLPRKDAMAFMAEEHDHDGKKILTVFGFSGNSSMAVYRISSEEHGYKLLILAYETLVRRRMTGNF